MDEPFSHSQAIEALTRIRDKVRIADKADAIEARLRREHKEAKEVAKLYNALARDEARAQTKPLPLFDVADGILSPGEVPNESFGTSTSTADAGRAEVNGQFRPPQWTDTPVGDLVAPEEVLDALKSFGIKSVAWLLRWRDSGCAWTMIPGIDEAGAGRLDDALRSGMEQFFAAKGVNIAEPVQGDSAGKDAA